jgi:nicotinate-nucleotide adenylyltransferase
MGDPGSRTFTRHEGAPRIALFGGTFDPPHRGHLGIATAAADAFALDSVLFAPVGLQPLKVGLTATPFADRLAMVELACAADPRFVASTIDAPQPGGHPNYTVDTLATLCDRNPQATLYSLAGADSFLSLRQWREPERLLELAEWIVVSRPGFPLNDLASLRLTPQQRSRIHLVETVHEEVSATQLRERLLKGEPCDDLLPPAVAEYIRLHGLYTQP